MQLNHDLFTNTMQPASRTALAAVEALASQGGLEARGAVFTCREAVDFILDLAAYTPDKPLHEKHLLAAWRGHGVFGPVGHDQPEGFCQFVGGHVAAQAGQEYEAGKKRRLGEDGQSPSWSAAESEARRA